MNMQIENNFITSDENGMKHWLFSTRLSLSFKVIHLTRLGRSSWLLTSWIINEFEKTSFHHSGKCAEPSIIDKFSVTSCDSRRGKDGQVAPCNKDLLFNRENPKVKFRLSQYSYRQFYHLWLNLVLRKKNRKKDAHSVPNFYQYLS